MTVENEKHLQTLLRHMKNVAEACELLGQRLIIQKEETLGIQIISNGRIHDYSKFYGIEWKYLRNNYHEEHPEEFKMAAYQHIHTNPHHPEYWDGIQNTPTLYIAEMVCDWYARSNEFGNDIHQWIDKKGLKKFSITKKTKKYQEIKKFLGLLLEEPFK